MNAYTMSMLLSLWNALKKIYIYIKKPTTKNNPYLWIFFPLFHTNILHEYTTFFRIIPFFLSFFLSFFFFFPSLFLSFLFALGMQKQYECHKPRVTFAPWCLITSAVFVNEDCKSTLRKTFPDLPHCPPLRRSDSKADRHVQTAAFVVV